jgi:hypothetical protein
MYEIEVYMKKDRICLDNCCYNRPFDDQEQPNIRDETTEIFISTISANKTNYTEWWRDNLYCGMSVEEIARRTAERFPQKSVRVENGS